MPRRGRAGRELRARLLVLAGLALLVVALYTVVVVGGRALLGLHGSPLVLSVAATAVVALGLEPAQRRLEEEVRPAAGGAASAYEVLRRFSRTVTGGWPTQELPARMARLLAEGTGAVWAQVWVTAGDRAHLAASWPEDAPVRSTPHAGPGLRDDTGTARRAVTVRHGGQAYGVLRLQERPGLPLSSVEERLLADLAAQAGLVLRLVALSTDLAARRDELAARAGELAASRDRLIAAQDAERRRLERDMHDGAQQHLVALAVNLRLAQTLAARGAGPRAAEVVAAQAPAARAALEALSELSRGIYPSALSARGLVEALRAAVPAGPVPVTICSTAAGGVGRLPEAAEQTLYFVALEALQNVAKHARATAASVRVGSDGLVGTLVVTDDGVGLPVPVVPAGSGLDGMRDRLDAVGGSLSVRSRPGQGTVVTATVPLRTPAVPQPRR